jgi:hypothetical protein
MDMVKGTGFSNVEAKLEIKLFCAGKHEAGQRHSHKNHKISKS